MKKFDLVLLEGERFAHFGLSAARFASAHGEYFSRDKLKSYLKFMTATRRKENKELRAAFNYISSLLLDVACKYMHVNALLPDIGCKKLNVHIATYQARTLSEADVILLKCLFAEKEIDELEAELNQLRELYAQYHPEIFNGNMADVMRQTRNVIAQL